MRTASFLQRQVVDNGVMAALLFALLAERLSRFYDEGLWLKQSVAIGLAADWLRRANRSVTQVRLQALAHLSDELTREIVESLSREAGLYTAYDLMESLDPNHRSETSAALMDECWRRVEGLDQPEVASPADPTH